MFQPHPAPFGPTSSSCFAASPYGLALGFGIPPPPPPQPPPPPTQSSLVPVPVPAAAARRAGDIGAGGVVTARPASASASASASAPGSGAGAPPIEVGAGAGAGAAAGAVGHTDLQLLRYPPHDGASANAGASNSSSNSTTCAAAAAHAAAASTAASIPTTTSSSQGAGAGNHSAGTASDGTGCSSSRSVSDSGSSPSAAASSSHPHHLHPSPQHRPHHPRQQPHPHSHHAQQPLFPHTDTHSHAHALAHAQHPQLQRLDQLHQLPQLHHQRQTRHSQRQLHPQHHHHHQRNQHQHRHQHQHQHSQHRQHPPPQPFYGAVVMDEQGSHGLAAQQEAAKDYQPVLEGPLVGDKTPSDAITHEYAKADAVYVDKTVALPQTYSHYRPIQGDGNCGWRAIGFSYLEKLVEAGDQDRMEGEVARLMSLNHMLSTVGGYSYYEDWADEMLGLVRDLAANLTDPAVAHAMLLQRWNDASVEGGLIYYLRLLAATYLKANAATYDPFSVELVNHEIEHLGIVALVNVLLKPAGIALEIAYLDRSPGSQVNHHRFTDDDGDDQGSLPGAPVVYLLYRPDHYDILYRAPENPAPVTMQVNRVSSMSHDVQIASNSASLGAFSTLDFGALSMIPGFSGVSGMSSMSMPMPAPSTSSPVESAFSPGPQQSPWTSPFSDDVRIQVSQAPQPPTVAAQPPTPSSPTSPVGPSPLDDGGCLSMEQKRPSLVPGGLAASAGYPIRFSPVQLEYDESNSGFRESSFQVKTSTFKNSVWNRAHYGNPDFHPEEWSPEDDGEMRTTKKKGKRERE
ncbi:hypothetical protein ACCO45_002307 [Purpureocillium lilacinum]|uniref:Uncharacterized protein n=1 Tax=Purpureocillium lilacinum TaxID=33203 RepID=A0ACC4EC33_PURLI